MGIDTSKCVMYANASFIHVLKPHRQVHVHTYIYTCSNHNNKLFHVSHTLNTVFHTHYCRYTTMVAVYVIMYMYMCILNLAIIVHRDLFQKKVKGVACILDAYRVLCMYVAASLCTYKLHTYMYIHVLAVHTLRFPGSH